MFQDGVRINEAFADVVNWDLLPKNGVASMQLLPGSNPIFGLNTLGGALTIQMKDGFGYSGLNASVSAGSFGRVEVSADGGYHEGGLAAFAAFGVDRRRWLARPLEHAHPAPLRAGSTDAPTRIRRIWRSALPTTISKARRRSRSRCSCNPRQPYTWPDTTENRLVFVNGNAQHAFDGDTLVEANAYYRRIRTGGVNSNVNDDFAPPDDPFEAFNVNTSATTQSWGASLQGTLRREWWATQASADRRPRVRRRHDRFRSELAAGDLRRRPRHHWRGPVLTGNGGENEQPLCRSLRDRHDRAVARMEPGAVRPLQLGAHRHAGRKRRSTRDRRHQHLSPLQSRGRRDVDQRGRH